MQLKSRLSGLNYLLALSSKPKFCVGLGDEKWRAGKCHSNAILSNSCKEKCILNICERLQQPARHQCCVDDDVDDRSGDSWSLAASAPYAFKLNQATNGEHYSLWYCQGLLCLYLLSRFRHLTRRIRADTPLPKSSPRALSSPAPGEDWEEMKHLMNLYFILFL